MAKELGNTTLHLGQKPEGAQAVSEAVMAGRVTPTRGNSRDFLNQLPTERLANTGDDAGDWSKIPPEAIPAGCDVQWVVETVLGQQVEGYKIQRFTMNGWVPYPLNLYPSLMPPDYTGEVVRREGQILMIRRKELTDAARAEEKAKAQGQLRNRLREMALQPLADSSAPRTTPSIKQERFQMPVAGESSE